MVSVAPQARASVPGCNAAPVLTTGVLAVVAGADMIGAIGIDCSYIAVSGSETAIGASVGIVEIYYMMNGVKTSVTQDCACDGQYQFTVPAGAEVHIKIDRVFVTCAPRPGPCLTAGAGLILAGEQ
jgi:hypothetical protein